MTREELQAESAADVQEIKELMEKKNIRVEARQRIDTNTGFIELVAIFISEKTLEGTLPPPPAPVAEEPTGEHAG